MALGAIMIGWLAAIALLAQSQQGGFQAEPWMNDGPSSTGPAVGEKIPFFRATDQHGKIQDFNSVKGRNGAMIVFTRSADW
ncbi:MAG: hypothetical protein HY648_08880 [Acidobacteria bacterium]|nr:hypothetical protein [Acidobacteriota bacterium]